MQTNSYAEYAAALTGFLAGRWLCAIVLWNTWAMIRGRMRGAVTD